MHRRIPAWKLRKHLEAIMDRLDEEHAVLSDREPGRGGIELSDGTLYDPVAERISEIENGFEICEAMHLWLFAQDAPL